MKRSGADPLLRWRKEFPILSTTTYLISNSLGAMPGSVSHRMQEYADTWARRGVRAWNDSWWEMQVTTGDRIAPLIGARPGEISMQSNVSLAQSIIISCFDFKGKRNEVVYSDAEFPSVMYVYERFAGALGARMKIVRSEKKMTLATEKILRAISDRTLLVPISHVFFRSAYVQDVQAIAQKAHKHGAIVVLDAYHSVGIMPVDVRALGVDVLIGGVLKWLCGGPGGAFLWIKPSLRRKLQPKVTGWVAHKHPFAFTTEMRYRDDAFKFLNGTPSVPALYAAEEGPKIIQRAGIHNIRRKSLRQTTLLIDTAKNLGFNILSPEDPSKRGGTVTINIPHAYQVSRELLRRNILIDYREGAGIRIAPHFYNSDDEILSTLHEIRSILDTKSYRKHQTRKTIVT